MKLGENEVNAVLNDLVVQIANLTRDNAVLRAEVNVLIAMVHSKEAIQEENEVKNDE